MPCGPGIYWDCKDKEGKERNFYVKKPLMSGTSMGELRYLNYLMHHDERFRDTNGIRFTMEHAYFRGQVEISGYKVDGYCETASQTFIVEYNGKYKIILVKNSFSVFRMPIPFTMSTSRLPI